jgi:imidazoleglycerol-phosphate dehydratase
VKRFGYSVIPMDESLAEIALDVCGRPSLVYNVKYPQKSIGAFDISLMREFFIAFSNRARVSLHINVRYGENTHHMIEAVFKAFGKALVQAYTKDKNVLSTKGLIV